MKKALLCFFMFLFVMYFVTLGTVLLWKTITGDDDSVYIAIISSAVYSIILLALFLWRRWAVLSPAWLHVADKSVLFWAGIVAVGAFVPSSWVQELLPKIDDSTAATYRALIHEPTGYIMLCLLAPFVEEMVFRGAILRSLLDVRINKWAAIALSAALFAIVHGNIAQMPHAFISGLFLGWMYSRTGSILPGVAFHWVNNTAVYIIMTLMPQLEDMTMKQVFGSDVRVALAILCSLCIIVPALFQLNLRMKRA